ncbi:MAG: UDP-glucose/GDP-mannose dehydrogenase family protein [Clostridia bacterium]|nr:UDP-glucose/GDP-mannose dehydrogenase family protein [Clostridia bacterium]MDH7572244.1 UDP-glucose/GDP-mannose dehydrogenase family protein [Clostridia bacterium]
MEVIVLGLGYVGAVAAAALAVTGKKVVGIDIDHHKVTAFQAGRVPFYEPGLAELVEQANRAGSLSFATPDEIDTLDAQVAVICVGTPSQPNGAADLSQVRAAVQWVRDKFRGPGVVVMKSTIPPGTGRRLVAQYLSGGDKRISYVSNPEFLREGQAVHDWFHPDRIVIGGEEPESIEMARSLFTGIDAPVVITDITSAELIKYAANAFLATKISFINEIANLCEKLGANIADVTRAIGLDPRIGPSFLQAGIGYGGSCFPKDVRALDFLATANGHSFELLRAVISVNNRQRLLPIRKLRERLGDLAGKRVAVLGLAFKPGTDDVREAPAIDIVRLLLDEGAEVRVYDPLALENARSVLPPQVTFAPSVLAAIAGSNAVVLATEWPEFIRFDWGEAASYMQPPRVVVDGRNCLPLERLLRCGLEYIGVGTRAPNCPRSPGEAC